MNASSVPVDQVIIAKTAFGGSRGCVFAQSSLSNLSWLGASVTTSSCHEQTSFPLKLAAWWQLLSFILEFTVIFTLDKRPLQISVLKMSQD
jgi:hypothetical protein